MLRRNVRLKIALIENDIKICELAKRIRLNPDYISQVIGGIANLGYPKQVEVAEILGVPREILFR